MLWVPIGGSETSLSCDDGNEIVVYQDGDGYCAELFYKYGGSKMLVSKPLPMDYCIGACEDYARQNLKLHFADTTAPWMNDPPSQGQIKYINDIGFPFPYEVKNKAQASLIISTAVALEKKQKRLSRSA